VVDSLHDLTAEIENLFSNSWQNGWQNRWQNGWQNRWQNGRYIVWQNGRQNGWQNARQDCCQTNSYFGRAAVTVAVDIMRVFAFRDDQRLCLP
jgi:hypothetical protein